jgi:hypothetical protein
MGHEFGRKWRKYRFEQRTYWPVHFGKCYAKKLTIMRLWDGSFFGQRTKKISGLAMVLHKDYGALIPRMEELLAELDRLQLPMIAVHVDLALSNLKELVAGSAVGEQSDQN